jgi:hypothetical protein
MSRRAMLEDLCRLEAQRKHIQGRIDDLRRILLSDALDELHEQGMAPTWKAKGLGSVILTVPEPRRVVYDEDAFAAYVDETWPGGTEQVRRVTPAAREAILHEAEDTLEVNPRLVDCHGQPIPGVRIEKRLPFLVVRLTAEAKAAAAGEVDPPKIPDDEQERMFDDTPF